jgi:hypothetical protein
MLTLLVAVHGAGAGIVVALSQPLAAAQLWLETVGQPLPSPSPSATPATFGAGVFSFSFLLSPMIWVPR